MTFQGGSDVFVAKLDAAGTFTWAKSAGGSATDMGWGIAVGSSGNSFATGVSQARRRPSLRL